MAYKKSHTNVYISELLWSTWLWCKPCWCVKNPEKHLSCDAQVQGCVHTNSSVATKAGSGVWQLCGQRLTQWTHKDTNITAEHCSLLCCVGDTWLRGVIGSRSVTRAAIELSRAQLQVPEVVTRCVSNCPNCTRGSRWKRMGRKHCIFVEWRIWWEGHLKIWLKTPVISNFLAHCLCNVSILTTIKILILNKKNLGW